MERILHTTLKRKYMPHSALGCHSLQTRAGKWKRWLKLLHQMIELQRRLWSDFSFCYLLLPDSVLNGPWRRWSTVVPGKSGV